MIAVRPAKREDEQILDGWRSLMGEGLTSIPRDLAGWRKKIETSEHLFQGAASSVSDEAAYLLVMEETATHELVGTCQLFPKTLGSTRGFYYTLESLNLTMAPSLQVLKPIQRTTPSTEMGGLFLNPSQRAHGLSRLLSLSRFLLIASRPHCFQPQVIAEMRGHIEPDMSSPFWEAIGKHFLPLTLTELMERLVKDSSFIPSIIPPFPIYTFLLSPQAQATIGKINQTSAPALKLLLAEGFHLSGDLDLFFGAPKLLAATSAIRTIQGHGTGRLTSITPLPKESPLYLIASKERFRATRAPLVVEAPQKLCLSAETAAALQVEIGDELLYVAQEAQ